MTGSLPVNVRGDKIYIIKPVLKPVVMIMEHLVPGPITENE